MNQRTLLGRLFSPAGFALVLIFFLLPFATVSCGDAAEKVDITFTGVNAAVGSLPGVASPDGDPDSAKELAQLVADEIDLEPLALLAVVATIAGLAVAVVHRPRIRHGAAAGLAVGAAVLIVGAVSRIPAHVNEFVQKVGGAEGMPAGTSTATHLRFGFWLALITLIGLAAGNGFALLRARRVADPAPRPPEPEPGYLPLDELTETN